MKTKLYRQPININPNDPVVGLSSWLADCQVDEAAAARARQRSLENQAAQEATIAGVVIDLAEQDLPVTLKTNAPQAFSGQIIAVGSDFVFVLDSERGEVVVPTQAITTITSAPTSRMVSGVRTQSSVSLAEMLNDLVLEKARVTIAVGADAVSGRLHSVGTDVVVVALSGAPQDMVYIAVAAIDHLLLLAR